MDKVDHSEMTSHLWEQVEAVYQIIQLIEQDCNCIEIIRRLQQVRGSLCAINSRLLDSYLEICLNALTTTNCDCERILEEISMIYASSDVFTENEPLIPESENTPEKFVPGLV